MNTLSNSFLTLLTICSVSSRKNQGEALFCRKLMAQLFQKSELILNNSARRIKVNCAGLHPRPERRDFTPWLIKTTLPIRFA